MDEGSVNQRNFCVTPRKARMPGSDTKNTSDIWFETPSYTASSSDLHGRREVLAATLLAVLLHGQLSGGQSRIKDDLVVLKPVLGPGAAVEADVFRDQFDLPLLRPSEHRLVQLLGQYGELHVLGAAGAPGQSHVGVGVAC